MTTETEQQLYVIMKYDRTGLLLGHSHAMPKGMALGRAKAARKRNPGYYYTVEPYKKDENNSCNMK